MKDNKNPFEEENKEKETVQDVADNNQENIEEQEENIKKEEEKQDNFQEKYEELNNKYIRLAADFDNFRKRTQSEKEMLSIYAKADILSKILTVVDTFERADESLKNVDDVKTVKEGYEVAIKQLEDVLKKVGLTEIEALGKEFDPNEHEAVAQIETDEFKPNMIAYVAQKGYKLENKIIRPALVGVAKEKENN